MISDNWSYSCNQLKTMGALPVRHRCICAFLAVLNYNPTVGPLGWRLVEWRMGIQGSLWQSC